MATTISLRLDGQEALVDAKGLIIAGWAGRDAAVVQAHIEELAELGVAPPASTPLFYRVSAALLTVADTIEVLGEDSSGEAECVLLRWGGELWVGIGSDHTDRKVEAVGVSLSKQMCEKPVGRLFWRFSEVEPHWDALALRSWRVEDGARVAYQDGSTSELLAPAELIAKLGGRLEEGWLMFCGTVPVIGPIRGARRFAVELSDPVRGRALSHEYGSVVLPIVG